MNDKKIFSSEINQKGFSLVEVLIATFMIAIILGLASTSFLNLAPKYKLKSAVREINSRLNYARYKSIFEGVKVRIKFAHHSYAIETYDEEKKEWKREREYFLDGVTLQANNSPTFHPVGTVSNLASIYISNSWGKYKITLAISGRIKIIQL
ncbi:MAG: prepilin-type N-terminal cleavage/methylation domain-containing protein [Candidatus Aminicenantes bacterium]|nr:prepilin-type N-terminal cleavage/methylation domain-containing protein [Candidatus Aminicenantes bacterium]